MNARIVESTWRTDQAMLDIIKGHFLAEERDEFLLPGRLENAAQILDRFEVRILAQHQFDGPGVIAIDQEGQPLRFGPLLVFSLWDG